MNQLYLLCVLSTFLLTPGLSLGLVRDCSTIQEVLSEATPDTLVVFDIDNTLIRPCQLLGSEEWFQYHLKQKKEALRNDEEALNQTLDLLHSIYAVTKVQPMEPETAKVVGQVQNRGGMVIGLTSRGPMSANMTIRHLTSVGIDLSVASPTKASFPLIDLSETLYHRGIIFSNGKSKRQSLLSFFRQLSWRPQRIVYVNDQGKYLDEVSAFENEGISYTGLRYSRGDAYMQNFNPLLCDIELDAFTHLISDDVATKVLHET